MDIFVSWAGRDSHAAARILREWLPEVLPFVRPWVSSEDIRKGTRWSDELWGRLQRTSYCIVCLTPSAIRSPWVNFEAGAVARAVRGPSYVSPLLLGISPTDLAGSPLAMFQCTEFTERDVERLLKAVNTLATAPIPESQVSVGLGRTWASLRDEIGRIDLHNTEDSEEEEDAIDDDTLDGWLHETEEKILACVAWSGDDRPLTAKLIAHLVNQNHVVTRHYVDQLVHRGFLHEQRIVGHHSTYVITSEGRAYAVEEDLT
ncbi:toll/interleukin-1 receptor domain-containing protein [Candidatus Palauibacter sp.]|uniref:toll/interleukin-1 receptor domain-containing protein n=1 Tax=Candidatus Palauibacter sp. TaxID=3101350 RepID=UPI003B5B981F